MKNKIPLLLIYSRLVIGFLLVACSIFKINNYPLFAVTMLSVGLLTDVFDGIIARQLNISNQNLRRLDSSIDQVFFICAGIATYIQCPEFFKENAIALIALLSIEAATYLVSFIKFRKEVATHSIGAKIWTLLLVATLIQVMLQCHAYLLFTFCLWAGIISRLEIIGILLTLKTWTNDVPSIYHALRLRKNKPIKRHKMLNG